MDSVNKRDSCIDIIKGLGISFMVAGHCGSPITKFITLFHMAIFFVASGYCYKEKMPKIQKVLLIILKENS